MVGRTSRASARAPTPRSSGYLSRVRTNAARTWEASTRRLRAAPRRGASAPRLHAAPRLDAAPPRPTAGKTLKEIARIVRHSPSTCMKALARHALEIERPQQGGARKDELGDEGRRLLRRAVEMHPRLPDAKYAEIVSTALERPIGVGVVRGALEKMRLRRKKLFHIYAECARHAVPAPATSPPCHLPLSRAPASRRTSAHRDRPRTPPGRSLRASSTASATRPRRCCTSRSPTRPSSTASPGST